MGAALLVVACACSADSVGLERDPVAPARLAVLTSPVLTRAYRGRESANLNRRWAWEPVAGADAYVVTPDWLPPITTTATSIELTEAYEDTRGPDLSRVLSQGAHTLSVVAMADGIAGPPAVDTITVRYFIDPSITSFGRGDTGLGGVVAHRPPGNIIGARYKFRIDVNRGTPPGNKIIFGGNRFVGPAGPHYAAVQMFEMSRRSFAGPVCDVTWPPGFTNMGESSVWIAIGDPTGTNQQGLKTRAPQFSMVHSYIDGDEAISNRAAIYQGNLNGVNGSYQLVRSALVSDSTGWRCVEGRSLPPGEHRQWDATVEVGGTTSLISMAVPAGLSEYLDSNELQGWRWEFPTLPGYATFYAWDVELLPEGGDWVPWTEWRVNEFAGFTVDFGVTLGSYDGHDVIELSNDAPGDYLPLGAVFTVRHSSPMCTPTCIGRACGDDGCGGTCGACAADRICDALGGCDCAGSRDDCGGACVDVRVDPRNCGGCGGTCAPGESCLGGTCTATSVDGGRACIPSCAGRECGGDACEGSCGACSGAFVCASGGQCLCPAGEPTCAPDGGPTAGDGGPAAGDGGRAPGDGGPPDHRYLRGRFDPGAICRCTAPGAHTRSRSVSSLLVLVLVLLLGLRRDRWRRRRPWRA